MYVKRTVYHAQSAYLALEMVFGVKFACLFPPKENFNVLTSAKNIRRALSKHEGNGVYCTSVDELREDCPPILVDD